MRVANRFACLRRLPQLPSWNGPALATDSFPSQKAGGLIQLGPIYLRTLAESAAAIPLWDHQLWGRC